MDKLIVSLNVVADGWLVSIWRACWQGTVALIFVWAIVALFPKISPTIRCWLWRLAFLKLLVSFVWTTPIDLPLLPAKTEPNVTWLATPNSRAEKLLMPITFAPIQPNGETLSDDQASNEFREQQPKPSVNFASVLFLLWLLGLTFQSLLLVKDWLIIRRVKLSFEFPNKHEILSECIELCRQFGLRFVPRVAISEQVSSPILLGVFRPIVVLPSSFVNDCSLSQLRLMLAHELAHLKRKDLLWNWLPFIAYALFFFHPLVWLAHKELQLAQEMACDEFVLLKMNVKPRSYGEVLLRVAEECSRKVQKGLVVAGMNESFAALKRRLMAMQFVKPISRTKAIVWGAALISIAVITIVPWRLVAQPGKQTSQALTQRVRSTKVQVPLKKGMELTYEGVVRVTVSGKETQAKVKVYEFVKEVAPDGTSTVVSLHVFNHPVDKSASLRFVSVQPQGYESLPDEKRLAGEVPPRLLSLHFVKVLPIYFVPQRNLKVGLSWATKENLPVYMYVITAGDKFVPWFEVEMLNRVVKRERVDGVQCWVIRRTLTKPVPIPGGDWAKQLNERNETLWVDAKTRLIRRVEAETILEGPKGKFRHNALKLQLKSQRLLTGYALEQRLKELKWVENMQRLLSRLIVDLKVYSLRETLDGDKIDQAQALVKSLLKDIRLFTNRLFPKSPYIAYWSVRGEELVFLDGELERTEEFAERVGELAPDFELTSVDGKRYRLSELRGKVVLLNFAGIGLERSDHHPLRQSLLWLFEQLERIHQKYKDKGVVVLGIWIIHPPERQKEFVDALKVPFPILVAERKVFRDYKISSIPTDIVIGKDGRIRFIMGGYVDKRPLVRAIEEALKE